MLTMTHGRQTIALLFALFTASAGADHVMLASAAVAPPTVRELYGLTRPERSEAPETALVLVDFQEELFSGDLRLPDASLASGNAAQPKSSSSVSERTRINPSKEK